MTIINIQVTPDDLTDLRFAYTPLLEVATSYGLLVKDKSYPNQRRWIDEARRAMHGMEFPFIDAVIPPHTYIADFVTPTPERTNRDMEIDLTKLRATPPEIVRGNVEKIIAIHGETEHRRYFLAYPYESIECLIEELRAYWQRSVLPYWDHIQPRLDDDILHHARQMALHGTPMMLNELSPQVKYDHDRLEIDKQYANTKHGYAHFEQEYTLGGRGLYLVPTVFPCPNGISWQVVPEFAPMLIYGAYGGFWGAYEMPNPEKELILALGEARAIVLLAVQQPAHTSELAVRLHMTAGAVSQHLKRLNAAGLVQHQRIGYHVYYRLSERGSRLIDLFAR